MQTRHKGVIGGVKWTFLSSMLTAISRFLLLFLVARFLTKSEMGLLAILMGIIGLSQFFIEAGLGGAVIHKQTSDKKELGTANLINISLGALISVLICVLSVPIASFYRNDHLIGPIMLAAVPLFIQGFTVQYTALLKRDMKFDKNAKVEIASSVSNLLITAICLYFGFGLYAVIYGAIFSMSIKFMLLFKTAFSSFGFPIYYDRTSFKFYAQYGAYSIGQNVLNYLNREIDIFILGRAISAETLGVYYVLKQVVFAPTQLISTVITNVALPIFAKVQHNVERLTEWFVMSSKSLSVIYSLFYGTLIVFSYEIFVTFLNTKLYDSAFIALVFLSYFSAIRAIGHPVGSLLMAKGRADWGFYWNMTLVIFMPGAVFFGTFYGIQGVSLASLIITLLLMYPSWYFILKKLVNLSLWRYFRLFAPLSLSLILIPLVSYNVSLMLRVSILLMVLMIYFFLYRRLFSTFLKSKV